jgi:hypothetical protein
MFLHYRPAVIRWAFFIAYRLKFASTLDLGRKVSCKRRLFRAVCLELTVDLDGSIGRGSR